jgi:ATP synthase F1 gamma subunit
MGGVKILSIVKGDMDFNKQLSALLEVLKSISVSQYKALERKIKLYDIFNKTLAGFFKFVDMPGIEHPFVKPVKKKQIVVAITSDGGFLGGLNRQVINAALAQLADMPGKLIIIGQRGKRYANEANVAFAGFPGIKEEYRYEQAVQLRSYIIEEMIKDSIGYLKVVYPKPISFTLQRAEVVPFLPYAPTQNEGPGPAKKASQVIMESKPGDLLEYLIYLLLGNRLFEIFSLSLLSEFAARFMHLEESSQKLKEMDVKLRLEYFRIRHELIDRNMRELFSARLLFGSHNS